MVRRPAGRLLLAAAALILAVSACASGGQNGPGHAKPTVTISLPGHPSAAVTDIRAYALTEAQANKIKQACAEGAGIPGAEDDCAAQIAAAVDSCSASGSTCVPSAPCLAAQSECLYIANLTTGKLAVVEVCPQHVSALCGGGTLLSRTSVEKLPDPEPTTSPSGTASPSPSPSGSEQPSPSSPAPTTSSAGVPSSPAESGAGSSP